MRTAHFAYRYSEAGGVVVPDESGADFSFAYLPPARPGLALTIQSSEGLSFPATYLGKTAQGDPVFEAEGGTRVLYSDSAYDELEPFPDHAPDDY